MSTTDTTAPKATIAWLAGLAAVVGVGVPLALLLRAHGPGSMWVGFVVGAAIALVGFGVAIWRARRPDRSTPTDRALLHVGDERDDNLVTRSLAVVGLAALPLTGLATVALAVGVEMLAVMGGLLIVEVAVLVGAYAVISRRS